MVKISQKLLTNGRLRNDREVSLSGYEFLVMTVLYKNIEPDSRKPFTIRDLKMRMQYKKDGEWKLCMDVKTFKATINKLVEHNCIELAEPKASNKKIAYDDTGIKFKRGLKELNGRDIKIFYSVARAFICKQITQNEFKVFLCIVNSIKQKKSCTLEQLGRILCLGIPNMHAAVKNLEAAQCIEVVRHKSDKGYYYNSYIQVNTDKYDTVTS